MELNKELIVALVAGIILGYFFFHQKGIQGFAIIKNGELWQLENKTYAIFPEEPRAYLMDAPENRNKEVRRVEIILK